MWKLYYGPGTCALAAQIALEEAQARYEPVRLDMKNQQQRSAEYLAINPKGRVPALVTERGVITEVPAILAFVNEHVEAALEPTEGEREVDVDDVHLVYRCVLLLTLALSHAVLPATGARPREMLA